eukprot:GFKZ01012915.1.p1 GENE.GFKZ01012915.1~~GFKZ01012915.1.p1  ORF type:complete len:759 (-),score=112.19 GFKZ01012915.1:2737-5013(-)
MFPIQIPRRLSLPATFLRSRPSLRRLHTANPSTFRNPLVLQIWGSNTDVGKTVFSAALLRTATRPSLYLKPVQSGYPADDDARTVTQNAPQARGAVLHTLSAPVSPDLAAALSGQEAISDDLLREQTRRALKDFLEISEEGRQDKSSMALLETAGGVLSPAPSGTLQADLYRSFRLPGLLVGDSRLGGVSATLAAYEALRMRGYDVVGVVFFDSGEGLENEAAVERYVQRDGTGVFQAPKLPRKEVPLSEYFQDGDVDQFFGDLGTWLRGREEERWEKLQEMKTAAGDVFWYPFTQHNQLKSVTCIDSAHGNHFVCFDAKKGLHQKVDAIGSWWTNGVGHGNVDITKAVARASGRYGHVMFPEAVYEPAFELAKMLLNGPGKGWAERVFYSDDGSTAVEVALKMAFRKRAVDFPNRTRLPVKIVGLDGCYHGDTLGVMDCSPSSDFNLSQTPWYEPRGLFFEPPTAAMRNGVWRVSMPEWIGSTNNEMLSGVAELFDTNREIADYAESIGTRIDEALQNGIELGACLLEPVLLGAGGMQLVDPAFQRAMVRECRKRGIPIVFDEIFTGLWRLGSETGAELIGEKPDIAAYGKLLTGGVVPIAATVASNAVFRAFGGESKVDALLHGHSFTGHAVGCAASVQALKSYEALGRKREYWDHGMAAEISCVEGVEHAMALGTVFAFRLKGDSGYAATAAQDLVEHLRESDIFVRPLGNVIYLMCTPLTEKRDCDFLMQKVYSALGGEEGSASGEVSQDGISE